MTLIGRTTVGWPVYAITRDVAGVQPDVGPR
jgi:hypothetical protein